MELNKTVTSRTGNTYNVHLDIEVRGITQCMVYKITNLEGKLLLSGTGGYKADPKDSNYLVKATESIILYLEENYNDIDHVRSFEEWDGVIK